MTLASGEVRERHLECAADLRVHVVDLARESVRRKPFRHGVGVQKRPINFFRRRAEHAMKSNRVRHNFPFLLLILLRHHWRPSDYSPSRGGNSNVILPFLSITRNAGNGLPALEM